PPPATFQLIECSIVLAPLAAGEESPLQRVLQAFVVFPFAAAGDLGAGAPDVEPIQQGIVPTAVIGPLPNGGGEFSPVIARDRFSPIIEVGKNDPHGPGGAGVLNMR